MAKSNKPFHPLDAENNRRYKVTAGQSPNIPWAESEDVKPSDWAGYIRIAKDGDYTFKIQVDDNGFIEIDGKKVVEVTGSNSSTSKEGTTHLKKGFHYAKFHHENLAVPDDIKPYPNATQFEALLDGKAIELKDIDAPNNLWKTADAQRLLSCYNVVDYLSKASTEVWEFIGGWLNDDYHNDHSCALRLSIGLSSYGIDLKGAPGANNIRNGKSENIGGKEHVIISAASMSAYLPTLLGQPDYPGDGEDGYSTPQAGDIIVFGNNSHVGMCPGDNPSIGSFISGSVWLLNRTTLDD